VRREFKQSLQRMARHGILTVAMLTPLSGWGWGPVGHRTVGKIAEQFLLPETKVKLGQILGGQSLPEVASWADAIRPSAPYKFTSWYHFENIRDDQDFLQSLREMPQEKQQLGGVTEAILESEKVYLDSQSSDEARTNAVRFIVHFVGDIHQPMHTGRPEDKGGNMIPKKWDGRKSNLHAVWDSGIMMTAHADLFAADIKKLTEDVYATYLIDKFKKTNVPSLDGLDSWLAESLAMRSAAYQYADEDQDVYTERFSDAVDSRVYFAGVRLARFLNNMIVKQQQPSVRGQFRSAIEAIVGNLSDYMSVVPKETMPVRFLSL